MHKKVIPGFIAVYIALSMMNFVIHGVVAAAIFGKSKGVTAA